MPFLGDEDLPSRPAPLLEIGPDFLGAGNLSRGFELPGGAVWQPALWVFGDYRTGLNYFDNGDEPQVFEWANRLDIFANLRLSGTERILVGMSPLRKDNEYTGYTFSPDALEGFDDAFNARITTLFFEGEFGEIFPNLDPEDTGSFDYGFAVGRQPLFFQEGIMFNDLTVDALGITRDTIIIPDFTVDMRITGLFGWNQINRGDQEEDDNAFVYGLFTEADLRRSTVNFDFAYVSSDPDTGGDGVYVGLSSTQRIGLINTALRANLSFALDEETSAVSDGAVLFAEISGTPPYGDNLVYGNIYWGIEDYTSAARDPTTGGPLGQVGLLYAAPGLGRFPSALSNFPADTVGAVLGHQIFFNQDRTQVVLELGGQLATSSSRDSASALGARVQQAIGNRALVELSGFGAREFDDESTNRFGIRTELRIAF